MDTLVSSALDVDIWHGQEGIDNKSGPIVVYHAITDDSEILVSRSNLITYVHIGFGA